MKNIVMKSILMAIATLCLSLGTAFGQFTQTNNFGIFPVGGINPLINFNVKFASLGESGGAPGGTANGCDLYGFRSQIDAINSVNLGMSNSGFSSLFIPTLVFENGANVGALDRFWITNQDGSGRCGQLLSYYGQGGGNTVFTILGSGVATGGTWQPSDKKLKENVQPITQALDLVMKLNGVTYNYKTEEFPVLNLNEGLNYGFIAQEVEEIMPDAVRGYVDEYGEDTEYRVMQYDAIIPVLTEAIKEQQAVIQKLEERLAALEGKEPKTRKVQTLEGLELGQNRPNPAENFTMIDYILPEGTEGASLVILDLNGKTVAAYEISADQSQLKVNTTNFAKGTYIYSLVKDGQSLARKKMVIQ
ncbi:MAG: tail fiber domain-containing protein [Bacteroidia bacterium]|nr:tail fiber domain-containing protein [Bacteroidia bacterium]